MATKNIAIACQGGGSHAAYAAGVLQQLLPTLEDEKKNGLKLVGISGTSGGAICALLAWYGLLEGGSDAAKSRLEDFWHLNSANWLGEQLFNTWSILGLQSLRCEVQFSPYEFPLTGIALLTTEVWPLWARHLGEINGWMRGEYFRLDALVSQHVDFELVEAIGDFCSISHDIKRWLEADIESSIFAGVRPDQARTKKIKEWLESRIRNNLRMAARIAELMDANGFPADAPLRSAFRKWRDTVPSFDARALTELRQRMADVSNEIPQLLIGAVDVGTGEFTAFSSERSAGDGVSVKSILASAALPWIFQAVPIEKDHPDGNDDTHRYWDGLFSQNPPVKNFIAGLVNENRKPDEIWVAQINPSTDNGINGSFDIWDRRNELAGNLSLNQEVSFIDAINKRIELDGRGTDIKQKYVHVHRIAMDSEAVEREIGTTLGLASKLDRGSPLKDALLAHGRKQAKSFLLVRRFVEETFNDRQNRRHAKPGDAVAAAYEQLCGLAGLFADGGKRGARLFVDDMEIHPLPDMDENDAVVKTHWHMRGTTADGTQQVTLEGWIDAGVQQAGITFAQVRDIRVAESRPL